MNKQLMFWTPRILVVLYAGFVSLFALDVFSENTGFWQTVSALALHLIPTAMILFQLALSWRWERTAGTLFILAGLGYCIMSGCRLDWILVVAGPLFVAGLLFLFDWRYRMNNQGAS